MDLVVRCLLDKIVGLQPSTLTGASWLRQTAFGRVSKAHTGLIQRDDTYVKAIATLT